MARPDRWATTVTGRPAMRSPGRPPSGGRGEKRAFWRLIAEGITSEDAAVQVGVSPAVGGRWFREGGGMPNVSMCEPVGRYLSLEEREELALLRAQNVGVREIARQLRRSPSTISRELRRNAATRSGVLRYRATTAQWHADQRARRPRAAKLVTDARLHDYCRTACQGSSRPLTGPLSLALTCHGRGGVTAAAKIVGGRPLGVPSRSPTVCLTTSPMMCR